ncbi:hypothetical protein B0H12DRAFT_302939 [Mycena haematopus]|nr:hypothetical protein B0H12DRAFT_302939 [Mycena haematopus]
MRRICPFVFPSRSRASPDACGTSVPAFDVPAYPVLVRLRRYPSSRSLAFPDRPMRARLRAHVGVRDAPLLAFVAVPVHLTRAQASPGLTPHTSHMLHPTNTCVSITQIFRSSTLRKIR